MPAAKEKEPKTNNLNIYQKLVEVRKQVKSLHKDAKGYNFTYASGANVLNAIRPELDKQGIVIITKMIEPELRDGNLFFSKIEYEVINADHPEDRFTISWVAIGKQKDPSQSLGSGLTYSERYLLTKLNLIPTDEDDPDAQPPGGNGNGNKRKETGSTITPPQNEKPKDNHQETLRKISAACMWLGGGNADNAKSYFKTHSKYKRKDGSMREPQELKDLSEKEAQILWGKLKDYFKSHDLDMEVALKEYGKGGE